MVVVAPISSFAAFGERPNRNRGRRKRCLSRDGATATVASLALGGGAP